MIEQQPRQLAAAYKWGFLNTSYNCYHGADQWEAALADQRAYATLLAKLAKRIHAMMR